MSKTAPFQTIQFCISTQFSSIWPIDSATTPEQSGPGSDGFGWLFGFYGISILVGYLTPNSVYIYIYIYSTKDFLTNTYVGNIFCKQDFICLHKINQF